MSIPRLPRLKPEAFRWHSSPDDPRTVQRLANGTEAWVGIKNENAKGQYDNYLRLKLVVGDVRSVSLILLKEKFTSILACLRFEHPEVGCTASWGESGPPYIQYTPPESGGHALGWAWNSIKIRATDQDAFDFRTEIVEQRREEKPESAKALHMYIVSDCFDEKVAVPPSTRIEVLMHFNHMYFDGISERVLTSKLLQRFGESWGDGFSHVSDLKWGDEVSNLSEPILDAGKIDVDALGDDFQKAQDEFLDLLFKFSSSWGLDVGLPVGLPRTEWLRFTVAESKAMIQAVKARVGPEYTISHLGHTATMLALLKAKPLPADASENPTLVMPLAINGRRYLRNEFVDKQFSSCQTGAVVDFGNLRSWTVDENDSEAVKNVLVRGCKQVKKWYDYWVNKEFLLPLGISKDNFTAAIFDS